jgi:hypothetical protein
MTTFAPILAAIDELAEAAATTDELDDARRRALSGLVTDTHAGLVRVLHWGARAAAAGTERRSALEAYVALVDAVHATEVTVLGLDYVTLTERILAEIVYCADEIEYLRTRLEAPTPKAPDPKTLLGRLDTPNPDEFTDTLAETYAAHDMFNMWLVETGDMAAFRLVTDRQAALDSLITLFLLDPAVGMSDNDGTSLR